MISWLAASLSAEDGIPEIRHDQGPPNTGRQRTSDTSLGWPGGTPSMASSSPSSSRPLGGLKSPNNLPDDWADPSQLDRGLSW